MVHGNPAQLAFACSLDCLVTLRLFAPGSALVRHYVRAPGKHQLNPAISSAPRTALSRSARHKLTLHEHLVVLGGRVRTATLTLTMHT